MTRDQMLRIVNIECRYQINKWKEHYDSTRGEGDWLFLLEKYLDKTKDESGRCCFTRAKEKLRKNLIATMAIAGAALERLEAPETWRGETIQ